MATSLKHTLNPGFALLFAVGVERLYKVLDEKAANLASLSSPEVYVPLTMVLLTLVFGSLSSIANDRYLEAHPDASATSPTALITYASLACALVMFYFSVELAFVRYWLAGYAALCLVNAYWNWRAVEAPHRTPHVVVNLSVAVILIVLLLFRPALLTDPLWFYVFLVLLGAVKWWQRSHERFPGTEHR